MIGRNRPAPSRTQTGIVQSRPAPVGGWNAKDALANMPMTDAVRMVNWWPQPSFVKVRHGYTKFATGFPSQVESILAYQGGTPKLFGCAGGKIYDATAGGAIGAAAVSGLSNNRWQYVNFTTTGGTRYICCFNGVDNPQYWDGSNWISITGVSTPAITGVTTSTLINAAVHKSRLWMIQANSLKAWYLPVGTVGGAAGLFDLGSVFRYGGKLLDVDCYSADTGIGLDDHLVFSTDQGEIAVYKGTDVTDATKWALVGVYNTGGALGNRALMKYGGDLLIISQYGLLPVSSLLQSVVIETAQTLTDKIQDAISTATTSYGSNFGWQTLSYQNQNMLILNVPTSTTTFEQYVMNTITGSWARFTGWNAAVWELYQNLAYFGGVDFIGQGWSGFDDAGTPISTELKTAFDYFNSPGQLKQFVMVRPVFSISGSLGVTYGINTDYDDTDIPTISNYSAPPLATWDNALWDTGLWAPDSVTLKSWQFASGLGYAGALKMKTTSSGGDIQLSAVDYLFAPGGVL
jgi:hypothetical protein